MGSGLAPLRSLLLELFAAKHKPFSEIVLWQAALSREHLPFAKEYADWERQGAQIHICLDADPEQKSGNLIQVLRQHKPDLYRAMACWAGSEDFGQALRGVCMELGLAEESLLDNLSY